MNFENPLVDKSKFMSKIGSKYNLDFFLRYEGIIVLFIINY